MTAPRRRFLAGLALLFALVLALPLAACGRKGRLAPPPGANPKNSEVKLPHISVPGGH